MEERAPAAEKARRSPRRESASRASGSPRRRRSSSPKSSSRKHSPTPARPPPARVGWRSPAGTPLSPHGGEEPPRASAVARPSVFQRPEEELKREYLDKLRAERVRIRDDSRFAKYFEMLQNGLPRPAVEEAFLRDESTRCFPTSLLSNPDATAPPGGSTAANSGSATPASRRSASARSDHDEQSGRPSLPGAGEPPLASKGARPLLADASALSGSAAASCRGKGSLGERTSLTQTSEHGELSPAEERPTAAPEVFFDDRRYITWTEDPPIGGRRDRRPRVLTSSKDHGLYWPKAMDFLGEEEEPKPEMRPAVTVDEVIARAAYDPPGLAMSANEVLRLGRMRFKEIGKTRPATGRELFNVALENKLQVKTNFSEEEWQKFGITDLRVDDFIKSEKTYFTPDSSNKHARDSVKVVRPRAAYAPTPVSTVENTDTWNRDDSHASDLTAKAILKVGASAVETMEGQGRVLCLEILEKALRNSAVTRRKSG
ncbi:hypothetical protein AB1Y20_018855 [Prymnesium parvum]|uniref:Uncharacterized protein n=1 Tax=Prymnesium parvum TaxID=97485 RepID=A0AB34JQL4_PRYPA